jgi:hypothetical protein
LLIQARPARDLVQPRLAQRLVERGGFVRPGGDGLGRGWHYLEAADRRRDEPGQFQENTAVHNLVSPFQIEK